MSTQIVPFNFDGREVRVVTIDNEPWFVLSDLTRVLGLGQFRTERLDDGLIQNHPIPDALGRAQKTVVVSEAGMYEVVIRSDKPEAAAFRRWITSEVLPQIRKTGSYQAPASIEQRALAFMGELTQVVEQQKAEIAQLIPKADYVDTFVADSDLSLMRAVAKRLGMSESELRSDLLGRSWIYEERATRWSEKAQEKVSVSRYSAYSHKSNYFTTVPVHDAPRFKDEVMHTLKVTPQGAIARLYGKHLAVAS